MRALTMARTVFERTLEVVAVFLIALLSLLVIVAVVFRSLGSPLTWYDEVAGVLLAWVTYYGAALAALKRAHLGFPNLMGNLRPALRLPLTVVAEAVVIAFFAIAAWYGWQVTQILQGDYLTSLRWVPVSFSQSVVPIGCLLFVLAELLVLPDKLREAALGLPMVEHHQVTEAPGDVEPRR